ncbi:MAG: hypothetical protein WBO35_04170 [Candidatus Saccharimonadales bacterium]
MMTAYTENAAPLSGEIVPYNVGPVVERKSLIDKVGLFLGWNQHVVETPAWVHKLEPGFIASQTPNDLADGVWGKISAHESDDAATSETAEISAPKGLSWYSHVGESLAMIHEFAGEVGAVASARRAEYLRLHKSIVFRTNPSSGYCAPETFYDSVIRRSEELGEEVFATGTDIDERAARFAKSAGDVTVTKQGITRQKAKLEGKKSEWEFGKQELIKNGESPHKATLTVEDKLGLPFQLDRPKALAYIDDLSINIARMRIGVDVMATQHHQDNAADAKYVKEKILHLLKCGAELYTDAAIATNKSVPEIDNLRSTQRLITASQLAVTTLKLPAERG